MLLDEALRALVRDEVRKVLLEVAKPHTEPATTESVGSKVDEAPPAPDTPEVSIDSEVAQAATMLGGIADASADDIRRALRTKLASSTLHPDQGGDGEAAVRLIAARNLLIERPRAQENAHD